MPRMPVRPATARSAAARWLPYLAVAPTPAGAVTFMASALSAAVAGRVHAFAGRVDQAARLLTRPAALRQFTTVRSAGHKARVTEPSPTAMPGRGQPEDAVVIARADGATATAACANGHRPDGLADEERQSAACPVTGQEASHDK